MGPQPQHSQWVTTRPDKWYACITTTLATTAVAHNARLRLGTPSANKSGIVPANNTQNSPLIKDPSENHPRIEQIYSPTSSRSRVRGTIVWWNNRSCNKAGRISVGRPSELIVEEEQGIRNPLALCLAVKGEQDRGGWRDGIRLRHPEEFREHGRIWPMALGVAHCSSECPLTVSIQIEPLAPRLRNKAQDVPCLRNMPWLAEV
jgi:hypothetical protein